MPEIPNNPANPVSMQNNESYFFSFGWIKVFVGFIGNELADSLAGHAAQYQTNEYKFPYPISQITKYFKFDSQRNDKLSGAIQQIVEILITSSIIYD